jgi:hypothetical protein
LEFQISLAAWIIIGLVALIFISLNVSLLTAWIKRDNHPNSKIGFGLRHSLGKHWLKENEQLCELNRRANRLRFLQSRNQSDDDQK